VIFDRPLYPVRHGLWRSRRRCPLSALRTSP
jgi:hypothetical protein